MSLSVTGLFWFTRSVNLNKSAEIIVKGREIARLARNQGVVFSTVFNGRQPDSSTSGVAGRAFLAVGAIRPPISRPSLSSKYESTLKNVILLSA